MDKKETKRSLEEVRKETLKDIANVRYSVRNGGDHDRFIKRSGTHVYSDGLFKKLSTNFISSFG